MKSQASRSIIEVCFCQDEEWSLDRVGAVRLLEGFDFRSLVRNSRVHSLDVKENVLEMGRLLLTGMSDGRIGGSSGEDKMADTGAAGRRADGSVKVVGDTRDSDAGGSEVSEEIVGDRREKTGSVLRFYPVVLDGGEELLSVLFLSELDPLLSLSWGLFLLSFVDLLRRE